MPVDTARDDLPFGAIVRPHGVRGALLVRAFNADTERLVAGARFLLLLKGAEGPGDDVEVVHARPTTPHGRFVVRLAGVSDREGAEGLRGARLFVPGADIEPPGPDEFYYAEVIGYPVCTEEGACLGEIVSVFTAGTDMLTVRPTAAHPARAAADGSNPPAGEWTLPVAREVVVAIDHAGRRFVVRLPEGLEPESLKLS